MLRFYKFAQDLPAPVPAREIYEPASAGKGLPEECPPLRAANAFGWDVLNAFDLEFVQEDGEWRVEEGAEVEADWIFEPEGESDREENEAMASPLTQAQAWFWERDQKLPHEISPEVYATIKNQVKVSTFLFLESDPNEILWIGDLPNRKRPWRALSALVDTDWYPASYPWHCVLELDPTQERIRIPQGEPLCRLMLLRRDQYFAREMTAADFEGHFRRGQEWLLRHGREGTSELRDITRTYVKQQRLSRFDVIL